MDMRVVLSKEAVELHSVSALPFSLDTRGSHYEDVLIAQNVQSPGEKTRIIRV